MSVWRFRTPAQRALSTTEQMRREAQRQQEQEKKEQDELNELMRFERRRQQFLEQQENGRMQAEFKVEQGRQQDFDRRDSFQPEFQVEQRRQRNLDQQRAPRQNEALARFREVERRQQPRERFQPPPVPAAISEAPGTISPQGQAESAIIAQAGLEGLRRVQELLRRGEPFDSPRIQAIIQGRETFTLGETVTPEGQLTPPGTTQDVVGQLPEASRFPGAVASGVDVAVNTALQGIAAPPRFLEDVAGITAAGERRRERLGLPEPEPVPPFSTTQALQTALRSPLPEPVLDTIEGLPGGKALRVEVEFLTSPAGIITLGAFPVAVLAGGAAGIGAATAAREAGLSEDAQLAVQVAANVLAPGGGLVPAGVVTGPARAGGRVARELGQEALTRARLAPEAGAARLGGEGAFPDIKKLSDAQLVALQKTTAHPDVLDAASREFTRRVTQPNPSRTLLRDAEEAVTVSPAERRVSESFREEQIERMGRFAEGVEEELTSMGRRAGPVRGRVFPEELTPARVAEELRGFEPPTTPPREPPTAPPPPPKRLGGATPDDDEFRSIQDLILEGETPEQALIRRQEGAINTVKQEGAIEVSDGNRLLKEAGMGQSFRGTRVPKIGQVEEFDDLNRLLHNSSKVDSGELIVPERMRPAYDKLRAQTNFEEIARLEFDPEMALADDYFYRGWKPPDGLFTGEGVRGPLGRKPGFKMPRVDATYDEMRVAGFEPLFWNPFEQQRASRLMGIRYREQERLIEAIKDKGLAVVHQGGPVPKGWRTPRIGPAFEGKPYAVVDEAGEPRAMFTRRWIVPDSMADRLENVFAVTPDLGKVGKVDIIKVVDAITFIPKRAKLIASVFQHVDFLTRSNIGAWTGMVDALRAGQPIEAVKSLAKWPDSAYQILRASVDPGFRTNLRRQILDTSPLVKGRDVNMRMVSENGLSVQNVTILPDDMDVIAREIAQEALGAKIVKAPARALAAFERVWRQGLFEGVYPAAILTDIRNNIAPIVARNYPTLTDAQMAGRIASIANKKYSTIPASMSAIQNRLIRETLRRTFFSIAENEGLLRQAAGAVRGPEAAFWRTHWIGAFIGLIAGANVIHIATTGQALPTGRYSPISKTKFGILPIGYNRDFAAPDIPIVGRSGTEVTLDLVGQLDTALRVLDPISFISARESVPVRAALNQFTGKDFFGAPIDEVGPGGIVSRTTQLAFDLFAPIGFGQSALDLARTKIEGAETIIRPGEDRLGTTGQLFQATGVNLRAETTPQLLDRIRADVMRELEIEVAYEDLDLPRKSEVDAEVDKRIGGELGLRRETAKIRGQVTPEGQFFEEQEISRTRQGEEQLADDAQLNSRRWPGDVWRDKFRDRNRDSFNQREGLKQAFKVEFEGKERSNKIDIAIDAYYNVNVDDYPDAENPGRVNWGAFFAAQDAALSPLSSTDRARVMEFIRKFDTPTVKEFRKAQEIVDKFFETPKYEGLSLREGQELDKFLNETVEELQRRKLREGGRTFRTRTAIIIAAEESGLPEKLLIVALQLRRERLRARIINPERDEFLIRHELILAKFYPDLLEQQLSRAQEAELGEQAFESIAAR